PRVERPRARAAGSGALPGRRGGAANPFPPMTFIPIAEEMGLIAKIGTWVIHQACHTAAQWPPHLSIAVNLSAAQFEAGGVTEIVSDALPAARLETQRLRLENPQRLFLRDPTPLPLSLRPL